MAKPITKEDIQRMLKGLSNPYAVRRREDAKAFALVTESSDEIVGALETLSMSDPDASVREAAKFSLSAPVHQPIIERRRADLARRKSEEAKKREDETKRQKKYSSTENTAIFACPNCGFKNSREVKFCQNCGNSLTLNCRRCGTPNQLGVVYCGNCGTNLAEATFGIPMDEVSQWREGFGTLGWIEEIGTRTKQLLPQLEQPFDASKESILFLTYGAGANRIQDVMIDGVNFRRGFFGVIGTNWRFIFADTDRMKLYAFPYDDIASVVKPESGGMMNDIRYTLQTTSGHSVGIGVHLDAPGLVGLIAGFASPVTAGQVIGHKRRAAEVIQFLNLYFTRVTP